MKWTLEEINLLKSKGYTPFGDNQADYDFSSHSGFDYYILTKNEDGDSKIYSKLSNKRRCRCRGAL
jgi:hypothetical protein